MNIVNTNTDFQIGANSLRLTGLAQQTGVERLSTGSKVNRGGDDASGLAISKGMQGQIYGIRTATHNAEEGIKLIQTADGALEETQKILFRIRDLAVRASNQATLTSSDLQKLNNELMALGSELDRKMQAVTFNTKVLFNGNYSGGQGLQIGPDNANKFTLSVVIPRLSGVEFGGPAPQPDLLSVANARRTISQADYALNLTNTVRETLGSQQNKLNHILGDLTAQDINISGAKSHIVDADMAEEIGNQTRLQIISESGTAMLAQANSRPENVLKLLK